MADSWGRNSSSCRILPQFHDVRTFVHTGPEIVRVCWSACWVAVWAMFALLVAAQAHTRSLGYSTKQLLHEPLPVWWFFSCLAIETFLVVSCDHVNPVGMSGYYDSISHIDLGLLGKQRCPGSGPGFRRGGRVGPRFRRRGRVVLMMAVCMKARFLVGY